MSKRLSKFMAIVSLDCFVFWLIWEICFNGNTWAEWIVRGFIFILFFGCIIAARSGKQRLKYSKTFFAYHVATDIAFMIPLVVTGHYVLWGMMLAMEVMILSMPVQDFAQSAQRNAGGDAS